MKVYSMRKRCAALLFAIAFIVSVSHAVGGQSKRLSFDTLFPTNAYGRATEQCVKVWSAWDKVIRSKTRISVEVVRTLDCSLGQLVLAYAHLKNIPKDEKQPLAEQLHYLSRVIGTISDRSAELPKMDKMRQACLKRLIVKIKTMLEARMAQ